MKPLTYLLSLLTSVFALTFGLTNSASGQWVQTSGPGGGAVVCLTVDSGGYLFAISGGIFRSSDNGASWSTANKGLMTPLSLNKLVAAGGTLFAASSSNNYIVYQSTNRGDSWISVDSSLTSFYALTSLGRILIAGTFQGVSLSTNGGATWVASNNGLPDNSSVYTLASNDGILFAGTDSHGVFRSTDSGISWNPVNNGLTDSVAGVLIARDGNLYLGTEYGMFISSDNGMSWTLFSLNYQGVDELFIFENRFLAVTHYPGALLSTDNGTSWNSMNVGSANLSFYCFASSGKNLFAGTSDGVIRSNDSGKNWNFVNSGLTNLDIWMLDTFGNNLFAAGASDQSGGLFLSSNMGDSWITVDSSFGALNFWALTGMGQKVFAAGGYSFSNLFVSLDSGSDWSMTGEPADSDVTSLTSIGNYLIASSWLDGGVYISLDSGATWKASDSGLSSLWTGPLIASGPNLFLAALTAGRDTIFISTDSGVSWVAVDSSYTFSQVSAFASMGSIVFVGTKNGNILLVTNQKGKWTTETKTGFPFYINCFANFGENLFVGVSGIGGPNYGHGGVFLSRDSGLTWVEENLGLTDSAINSLTISNGTLYAGTSTGVWRRSIAEILASSSVAIAPQQAQSLTIYPNPVSHEATISFSSDVASRANVSIYNVLGSEVAKLYDGTLDAGNHSFTWDASSAMSGAYICVARMSGQVLRVPVVLAK